jgi:hypothetical protein
MRRSVSGVSGAGVTGQAVPALLTMMLGIPFPFNLRGQSGGDDGV